MFLTGLKWLLRIALVALILFVMSACTMLGLNYASLSVDNKPTPQPALTLPLDHEAVRATLSQDLYGPWPADLAVSASPPRMLDDRYLSGRGTLQEIIITLGEGDGARQFPVVLALPNSAKERPVPLLVSQTFSDNCSVFPDDPVSDGYGGMCTGTNMTGFFGFLATNIFGTYIAYAPIDRYFEAGLGYASFSGPSFIPDSREGAAAALAALPGASTESGTLIMWAKAFAGVAQVMQGNPAIKSDAIAALGHSRYGKAALVAAAYSPRINAALAHQSGFAGGSSSRSQTGETLQRMARSYPHWLRPGLAEFLENGGVLTYDQHYLLSLIAPKPILLGNGRRDVWSDPNSSYRIAQAADAAYEAMGVAGLPDADMQSFSPDAEIAYWLRVGGHSVVAEDIDAYIAFMQAHFGD